MFQQSVCVKAMFCFPTINANQDMIYSFILSYSCDKRPYITIMYGNAYMTILHVPTASTQMKIAKLKRFSKVESFHIIVRI